MVLRTRKLGKRIVVEDTDRQRELWKKKVFNLDKNFLLRANHFSNFNGARITHMVGSLWTWTIV
jgi:hypothetical protein